MYRLRTKPISMPQVIIPGCLLLAACGSSAASFTLHTEFTETFEQPALAIIHLFGYEKTLADAHASLIETYEIEVGKMPATLDIEIPDAAHERIDQGVGPLTARRSTSRCTWMWMVTLRSVLATGPKTLASPSLRSSTGSRRPQSPWP